MRYLILTDIHANIDAIEAIDESYDRLLCLAISLTTAPRLKRLSAGYRTGIHAPSAAIMTLRWRPARIAAARRSSFRGYSRFHASLWLDRVGKLACPRFPLSVFRHINRSYCNFCLT